MRTTVDHARAHAAPTTPVNGLDGSATCGSITPARYPRRPASTASRNPSAIATGSPARAIAVFTSTASAPSSIAAAASDGAPSPASTMTGTPASSTMIAIDSRSLSPRPEPIGAASGINVAQPMSSSRRASSGSGNMYGRTVKPSATSISAASRVPTGSGSRLRASGITSSLIQSGRPPARASRATRSASAAVFAPAVFGNNIRSSGRKAVKSPLRSSKSTSRTATVTNSAPEAATAAPITARLSYFPVPTMSREAKRRPAISRNSPPLITRSLRWHNPDQVQRSRPDSRLSARRAPVASNLYSAPGAERLAPAASARGRPGGTGRAAHLERRLHPLGDVDRAVDRVPALLQAYGERLRLARRDHAADALRDTVPFHSEPVSGPAPVVNDERDPAGRNAALRECDRVVALRHGDPCRRRRLVRNDRCERAACDRGRCEGGDGEDRALPAECAGHWATPYSIPNQYAEARRGDSHHSGRRFGCAMRSATSPVQPVW